MLDYVSLVGLEDEDGLVLGERNLEPGSLEIERRLATEQRASAVAAAFP